MAPIKIAAESALKWKPRVFISLSIKSKKEEQFLFLWAPTFLIFPQVLHFSRSCVVLKQTNAFYSFVANTNTMYERFQSLYFLKMILWYDSSNSVFVILFLWYLMFPKYKLLKVLLILFRKQEDSKYWIGEVLWQRKTIV